MLQTLFSPVTRISAGLVGLTVSLILMATLFGLFPNQRMEAIERRHERCESMAMTFSSLARRMDLQTIEDSFEAVAHRNVGLLSVGLRREDGTPMIQSGDHFSQWTLEPGDQSTADEMIIPISGDKKKWGQLEFRFEPLDEEGVAGLMQQTELVLCAFIGTLGFGAFYLYLRFVLRQLNPAKVIPRRVREAFDALAEGLVVMDRAGRAVLANQAFQDATGQTHEELFGKKIGSLPFFESSDLVEGPWESVLRNNKPVRGQVIKVQGIDDEEFMYSVSCAPITDDKGTNRGVIASFEDVTQLEKKKDELELMLYELDQSNEQIKLQNTELEFLATRDSLTGCINRRTFFKFFETQFEEAKASGNPLSACMVDIDHFKSINDNHGHAVGDDVLRLVAATLESGARETDIVCRYGGEEFSILLPMTDMAGAAEVGESIRASIQALCPAGLRVTASIGVSAVCQKPESPADLLEHADQCLYVAKRHGRNQVVRYDQRPIEEDEEDDGTYSPPSEEAIKALFTALTQRDAKTAEHCQRVSDLCRAVATGLLPSRVCKLLEAAGMLHDIGKIGVPDAILSQPGRLSAEQQEQMKEHEEWGRQLIHNTFESDELDGIIAMSRLNYAHAVEAKIEIPVEAAILQAADAFDSLIHDQPWRKALSQEEAFAELQRCAGEQFDPEIVDRLIQTISEQDERQKNSQERFQQAILGTEQIKGKELKLEAASEATADEPLAEVELVETELLEQIGANLAEIDQCLNDQGHTDQGHKETGGRPAASPKAESEEPVAVEAVHEIGHPSGQQDQP